MFYSFSKKLNRVVSVNEVHDLNETFCCLNHECSAEYFIRSADGHVVKHFCRKRSTPHCQNCFYDKLNNKFYNSDGLIKLDLLDIYNHVKANSDFASKSSTFNPHNTDIALKYIKTPKALLQFCLLNDLSEIYQEQITVKDIIVDSRTLFYKNYFEGVTGIKMVFGYTTRYDRLNNAIIFEVKTTTKNNKTIVLTAKVIVYNNAFNNIIKHILDTNNNKFSNKPIAVYGDWKITSKYNIECILLNEKNIIYKL